jgi:pimeloyl-ACP methyl ester carboxylesterase
MADPSVQKKATIVIIQGSFQTPLVYEPLAKRLMFLGFPIAQPPLPSCSNVDHPNFPSKTLIDDALAVRSELIKQIEYEGKMVVVVMHSYGGLVGSEAIPEDLTWTNRKARGLPGGVVHLYYFSAFILPVGKSVIDVFGESPNNDVKVNIPSWFLFGRFLTLRLARWSFWNSKRRLDSLQRSTQGRG